VIGSYRHKKQYNFVGIVIGTVIKKGILFTCLFVGWAVLCHAQQYDSTFSPNSVDTSFLHIVNNDPTGYLSGNEGLNMQLKGFNSLPGQTQPYGLTGTIDNLAVAIEIKKTHIGFTVMVGEGSNRPNTLPYCQLWAADNGLGPGTVSQASCIYYTQLYQGLGFFATLPLHRLSVDFRAMLYRCSWTSPDGGFEFTPAVGGPAAAFYQNFSGNKYISYGVMPGLGVRYLFFERFAIILNGDLINGFNTNHIMQFNASGGVAYEL
jgi:hypothetical protein